MACNKQNVKTSKENSRRKLEATSSKTSEVRHGKIRGEQVDCIEEQRILDHEIECDVDLHVKRINCKKNPGHQGFIPRLDFQELLPDGHYDSLVLDFIQTVIFLTVKVVVSFTSTDRPEGIVESDLLREKLIANSQVKNSKELMRRTDCSLLSSVIKVLNSLDMNAYQKHKSSAEYKIHKIIKRKLICAASLDHNHHDECYAEVTNSVFKQYEVEENGAQLSDVVNKSNLILPLTNHYHYDNKMGIYISKDDDERNSEVSVNAKEERGVLKQETREDQREGLEMMKLPSVEPQLCCTLNSTQEDHHREKPLTESDNEFARDEMTESHEEIKMFGKSEVESETEAPQGLSHKVQAYDAVEQEKQRFVMRVHVNTDIKSNINNASKKAEREAKALPEGTDMRSLMADLYSMRYFRIKPPSAAVFMLSSASRPQRNHPKALGDIPWLWLREEKWRLHTFANYPHNTAKSAILLASEGFAYTGSGKDKDDSVICYFCCGTKRGWLQVDVISDVHKALSPNCSMVTGVNCDNIPMSAPKNGTGLFSSLMDQHEKHRKGRHGRGGDEIESDGAGPAVDSHRRNYEEIQTDAAPDTQQVSEARPSREPASSNKPKMLQLATSSVARPPTLRGQTASSQTGSSTVTTHQASNSNAPSSTVTSGHSLARPSGQSEALNRQHVSSSNNLSTTTTSAQAVGQSSHVSSSTASSNSARTAAASTSTAQPQASTDSTSRPSAPASSTPTAPNTSTTNQTSNTQGEQGSTSQGSSQNSQGTSRPPGRGPTYGDLGIITERPKRYEYAVKARRLETFEHWPRDHHLKKEDLSAAGFYYAGYGDCARCFYCGGGLRNWEDDDNVWVEHARWFPKCAFIRQQMGQAFVDTVQDLNKDHDQISYKMVTDKMGTTAISFQLDSNNVPLKRDPAVRTVIDMGYHEKDVLEAAAWVKENHTILSADKLFEKLESDGKSRIQKTQVADSQAVGGTPDPSKDKETMETLKDQNSQLRQQTVCKICMDKEVAVVFLPCGHLVSCTDCAAAMKDCPVCRNHVKGIVRAFMS